MDVVLHIVIFVLGLIIGSFLNVVINRYGSESITGRSYCPSCKRTLSPFELIPLISFLLLKGRCRNCHTSISFQYPIVELLSGFLFTLVYLKYGLSFSFIFYSLIWSLLLVITVYDYKHTIIPDALVFSFAFFSFVKIFYDYGFPNFTLGLSHFFAGPIFFLPFFLLWWYSKGEWIGLGDGKLALGIGFFLGLSGGLTAIVLSFWIGAVVSLILLYLSRFLKSKNLLFKGKELTMKSEIPFGPFLILGTALVFFCDVSIVNFSFFVL